MTNFGYFFRVLGIFVYIQEIIDVNNPHTHTQKKKNPVILIHFFLNLTVIQNKDFFKPCTVLYVLL